ncbi:MAG TPA: Gfo/Idh/MocA family oxidoreductase, partial [Roseiflexaceae bacterium]|nr:Gfo/Idh/MocA family oxidoreductase [Roseiflexaceae bacterium]
MRVAIIGCGFVADYYMSTISGHPELSVIGAFDRNHDSLARFGAFHSVATYASLEELLADERVELVLNLTNPRSHYEVSRACLLAGKHVYSEKPLAMEMAQARELVELAKS